MTLSIVPYYASILAPLFALLSVNVIAGRQKHKIALGTGLNSDMERRIRVHGNFAEYVPLTLLLLMMLELRGASPVVLHGLCISLTFGRVVHAWGVSRPPENFKLRVCGTSLTFLALVGAALAMPFV